MATGKEKILKKMTNAGAIILNDTKDSVELDVKNVTLTMQEFITLALKDASSFKWIMKFDKEEIV